MARWMILKHETHQPDPGTSLQWLRAKTFLSKASPKASSLLDELGTRWPERTIYLVIHDGANLPPNYVNGFLPFRPEDFEHTFLGQSDGIEIDDPPQIGTVWWWATRPKDVVSLSPPLALAHELGHLYQWFNEPQVFKNYKIFVPVGRNPHRAQRWKEGVKYYGLAMSTHKGNKAGDDYVVKTWELPSAKEINEYIASRFREDQNLQAAIYNALLEPGRARYRISDFPWDKSAEESRHARPAEGPRARLSSEQYYSIILK